VVLFLLVLPGCCTTLSAPLAVVFAVKLAVCCIKQPLGMLWTWLLHTIWYPLLLATALERKPDMLRSWRNLLLQHR
jgi:hypothetical protein